MTLETGIFLGGMILVAAALFLFWLLALKRIFEKKAAENYLIISCGLGGDAKITYVKKTGDRTILIPADKKKKIPRKEHLLSDKRRLIMEHPAGLPPWFRAQFLTFLVREDDSEIIDPWSTGETLMSPTTLAMVGDEAEARAEHDIAEAEYGGKIQRKGTSKFLLVMIVLLVLSLIGALGFMITKNASAIDAIRAALGV